MVIEVSPSLLDEVIESMPAMVENWRSSGVATEAAMVSGSAPASLALLYANQLEDATAEAVSDFIGDTYRAIETARADLIEATLETVVTIAPVWPIYEGPQL
jgi:hypothetical protein